MLNLRNRSDPLTIKITESVFCFQFSTVHQHQQTSSDRQSTFNTRQKINPIRCVSRRVLRRFYDKAEFNFNDRST